MEEKKLEELERKLILDEKEFENHLREEEKEISDKIDAEIKELTAISKKDNLGF